jgi:hypothetical protein
MESIRKFNNFLPAELAQSLIDDIANSGFTYGWRSSKTTGFGHWNKDFSFGDVENGIDTSDKLSGSVLAAWNYIQEHYFPNTSLLRCYANAHTYGVEGYPHTDSSRETDHTVVVYLAPAWKREWGGETMFYKGNDIIHAELPAFNKAVSFPSIVAHQARSVTRICPVARITLMFKFAPNGIDPTRDKIQLFLEKIGANNKKHSKGTLIQHLLNVYDYLKVAKQPEDICVAGALHSVFGTNIFKDQTLNISDKDKLLSVASPEAIRLVELFSKVNRPSALEVHIDNQTTVLPLSNGETIDVTPEEINALCVIECANLHDQKSLASFPKLSNLWSKIYYKIDN